MRSASLISIWTIGIWPCANMHANRFLPTPTSDVILTPTRSTTPATEMFSTPTSEIQQTPT